VAPSDARLLREGFPRLRLVSSEESDGLSINLADGPEFGNVDRTLAGFTLIHVGMGHAEPQRNLQLRQARLFPSRD